MFFFDCEKGYQPDNGQNDVTDGSVENYDFDWGEPVPDPESPSSETQGRIQNETENPQNTDEPSPL